LKEEGIPYVPLYPGSRHSSVMALRLEKKRTPEEIKRATMHGRNNKAFDKYLRVTPEDARELYEEASEGLQNERCDTSESVTPLSHIKHRS